MQKTPSGLRPHILLLGRRNTGKSSLLNALTDQPLAVVSEIAGTTTDPVRKGFELLPYGPVVFIDAGGIDDKGVLGEKRVYKTRKELACADFVLFIAEPENWTKLEDDSLRELKQKQIPHMVVINKHDLKTTWKAPLKDAHYVSAKTGHNVIKLREELARRLEKIASRRTGIIGDLVKKDDLVILVVPIDLEAPQGRIILPQVMAIRDILDKSGAALVVKETELTSVLNMLKRQPSLVVCDSQVVFKVDRELPKNIPFTTFSILSARMKGDLDEFVLGAKRIDDLRDGDKVLIAEACSHHVLGDDIARIKIPKWIRAYNGKDIIYEHAQGRHYPDDIEKYRLVIHCGGCMITPKAMRTRMDEALGRGVPITNYGVTISYVHGVLVRVLRPFKEML
ncbi:MAG: [FeFe] hydrogenase H-cluster maturation GTPase HydF [Pseudomonadota bacterium]